MKKVFGVILIVFVFLFFGGSIMSGLLAIGKQDEQEETGGDVVNTTKEITFTIDGVSYTANSGAQWSDIIRDYEDITGHESGKVMKGDTYVVESNGYAVVFTDAVISDAAYKSCEHEHMVYGVYTSLSDVKHQISKYCQVCFYTTYAEEDHRYLNTECTECAHTCTHICEECGDWIFTCDHAVEKNKCNYCGIVPVG